MAAQQQHRNEKEEEKRKEKEDEKRGEKERGLDEKFRHNPVRAVTVAALLIWGGIVALINNFYRMPWDGWSLFFVGAGVILIIKSAIRLMPAYRRPAGGGFIIGIVLFGVGLAGLIGWAFIWPIVLIIIALAILIGAFARRK